MSENGVTKPKLTRSPSIALKNYEKWRKVEPHAVRDLAGLLAMKLPYDEAKLVDSHCISAMKAEFPSLGLVLDLQVRASRSSQTVPATLPSESIEMPISLARCICRWRPSVRCFSR